MDIEDFKIDGISEQANVPLSNTQSQSFQDRQKAIFDRLNIDHNIKPVTSSYYNTNKPNARTHNDRTSKQPSTRHLRGRESIFKRPEAPISKCLPLRRAPDYLKNPHKWVKYSLDDVKLEDMSEKSNTAAAFTFLKEMEQRKQDVGTEEPEESASKIVFKKRVIQFKKSVIVRDCGNNSADDLKPNFKSSKLVMPEYVVGMTKQRAAKKLKNPQTLSKISNEMKLDHLFEEVDDGD